MPMWWGCCIEDGEVHVDEVGVDPWMVELRVEMLLKRDLGGAGGHDVRGEL